MANMLTVKAQLGKIEKVRGYLIEVREKSMKLYSIGKSMKCSEIARNHGVNTSCMTWLEQIGAVKDETPAGTPRSEGKKIKWVYKGNEDGVVDRPLIDALIKKERDYMKASKEQRTAGVIELLAKLPPSTNGHIVKLPTGKRDSIAQIVVWIDGEMKKNELVPGYLKNSESIILPRIKEVLHSLVELKEVITKLGL